MFPSQVSTIKRFPKAALLISPAVTEWSLSTDILNNPSWLARFWSTQLTAFPNPVFWRCDTVAFILENLTLTQRAATA